MDARITGVVVAGRGLGVSRMDRSAALERLSTVAGCPLVPGTLNVRLPGALVRGAGWRYLAADDIGSDWQRHTGQAGYFLVRVRIADRYRGVAFQADEPGYPRDQIELVAEVRLRDVLGLHDGDAISASVLEWRENDA